MDLSSDDTTLILASDGVFEFMSDEEVVDLVCNGNAVDADDACSQVTYRPPSKNRSGMSLIETMVCRHSCRGIPMTRNMHHQSGIRVCWV